MNYRRLTPSMSLLLAFEAAARHESFTRAGTELSLSQSAVSRQVQALEGQLGLPLFRREGRRVELTDAGRRYYLDLSDALGRIRSATLQVMSYQAAMGSLRLATLPTFGSKWLLPRLHEFYTLHPGVNIHIHSRIGPVDFANEEIDAVITVDTHPWPGLAAHRIDGEFLLAIHARQASLSEPLEPAWAYSQTLLTVASHAQGWSDWFSHYQLEHRAMRLGPSFELTSHLIQAVRANIGIGLVPQALVQDELQRGELASLGTAIASGRTYYLMYPPRNESLPALHAFKAWLLP